MLQIANPTAQLYDLEIFAKFLPTLISILKKDRHLIIKHRNFFLTKDLKKKGKRDFI